MICIPIGKRRAIALVPEIAEKDFKKAVLIKNVKPIRYLSDSIEIYPCGENCVVAIYFERKNNHRRFLKTKMLIAMLTDSKLRIKLGGR